MQPSSPYYLAAIRELWEFQLIPFFNRDGKDLKYPNGGYDLRHNKQLCDTLEKMGKTYLPLCARKVELMDQKHALLDKAGRGALNEEANILSEIREIEDTMVQYNATALAAIRAPGSGLDKEMERHPEAANDPTLRDKMALTLLSNTIGMLANSCSLFLKNDLERLGLVPKRFV